MVCNFSTVLVVHLSQFFNSYQKQKHTRPKYQLGSDHWYFARGSPQQASSKTCQVLWWILLLTWFGSLMVCVFCIECDSVFCVIMDGNFNNNIAILIFIESVKGAPNADLKSYRCLCLHIKIICWKFRVLTAFTFWVMCTWNIWNVCWHTETI